MPAAENIHAPLAKLTLPIGEVHPRKGNPRRGDIDVIAESLERNGQFRPIVVNKATGEILAGNHTYAAAKRLGWGKIAATFVDVDEDQAARIVLADNRSAELGSYDDTLLLNMLNSMDGDLIGTGYTRDDVDALLALSGHGVTDLDDLADELGDLTEEDTWPVLRFKLPPDVLTAWQAHADGFNTEHDALAALLNTEQPA